MSSTGSEATTPIEPVVSESDRAGPAVRLPGRLFPVGLLAIVAVGVATLGGAAGRDAMDRSDVVSLVLVLVWAVAGTFVLRDRNAHRLGILAFAGAVLGGTAFAVDALGESTAGTAGAIARFVLSMAVPLLVATSAHFLLALPRGELIGAARRRGSATGYAAALGAGIALWAGPGRESFWVGAGSWTLAVAVSLPAVRRRYRGAGTIDRQRLQWLGCGAAGAAEVVLVVVALHMLVRWPDSTGAPAALGTVLVPLALAATTSSRLIRHGDRLLVLTASATGLTFVVITVYLLIVLGLGGSPDVADRRVLGLSMLAAAVTAVSYVPARRWLNELATRLVYGDREAPEEVLRTFETRLTRSIPIDELMLQLVESLHRTMALSAAEIWTCDGNVLERAVSVPNRPPACVAVGERERSIVGRPGACGNAWVSVWLPSLLDGRQGAQLRVASITHSGALLGLIVAERALPDDAFGDDHDWVLTELARRVGGALHNVQLNSALQTTLDEVRRQAEELRASRTRIVATADAERRKIERNLHDGAQQHLVALAVNLRLVKDILGDDPAGATEMIEAMATDVKETIQDLRDLAHGIYPPLLLDSGLVEALKAAANRSPLDVRVSAEGVGRYEPDLEAAVYFCCLEALQNAAKHAPGALVELRVREESGSLLFEVADDGPGFASMQTSGQGFVNMSDRLGAIGGTIRWEPNVPSGALVTGAIACAVRETGS